jgi:hypothetical protein
MGSEPKQMNDYKCDLCGGTFPKDQIRYRAVAVVLTYRSQVISPKRTVCVQCADYVSDQEPLSQCQIYINGVLPTRPFVTDP